MTVCTLDVTDGTLTLRRGDTGGHSVEFSPAHDRIHGRVRELITEYEDATNGDPVRVRLHAPFVQVRTLRDLPPVSDEDLAALVRSNLSRFFRRVEGDAVVAAAWSSDEEGKRIARAAYAPLDLLRGIEAGLEEAGTEADCFQPVLQGEELHLPLLTPRLVRQRRARLRRRRVAMAAVAVMGWLATGLVYVADLVADGRYVRGELDALAGPLAQIEAVEADLEAFSPVAAAVDRQSSNHDRVSDLVVGLDGLLPASAHVHSLSVERVGPVRLMVHGDDPVDVVRALRAWWPGPVRITETRQAEGPDHLTEFGVTLERDG